ncbi:hypothetical protein [Proteus mirabilis]|uniref:hypothetical protein n=1 Tax=Proteus mirabilis TaxID=584 RepID=UPI0034D79AD0
MSNNFVTEATKSVEEVLNSKPATNENTLSGLSGLIETVEVEAPKSTSVGAKVVKTTAVLIAASAIGYLAYKAYSALNNASVTEEATQSEEA